MPPPPQQRRREGEHHFWQEGLNGRAAQHWCQLKAFARKTQGPSESHRNLPVLHPQRRRPQNKRRTFWKRPRRCWRHGGGRGPGLAVPLLLQRFLLPLLPVVVGLPQRRRPRFHWLARYGVIVDRLRLRGRNCNTRCCKDKYEHRRSTPDRLPHGPRSWFCCFRTMTDIACCVSAGWTCPTTPKGSSFAPYCFHKFCEHRATLRSQRFVILPRPLFRVLCHHRIWVETPHVVGGGAAARFARERPGGTRRTGEALFATSTTLEYVFPNPSRFVQAAAGRTRTAGIFSSCFELPSKCSD